MSAYMALNGVPATGNQWLLQDVLRKDWGFQGFVVSDWDAVRNLETHGFAASPQHAALLAARAGVNMEMISSIYSQYLPAAVTSGKLSQTALDNLVRPILETKDRLGLFDHPFVDMDNFHRETLSAAQRRSVREAAEQTAVLLKNDNHLLPLRTDLHSIAVIGPLADSALDTMGSWAIHGDRRDVVTIAQGIREALPNAQVNVTTGVEIERGAPTIFDEQVIPEKPRLTTEQARASEFAHAVDLARSSDVAVLVLGEAQTMNGEDASRASLSLPGQQEELLEAIVATGKPVVLVLMTGRPLDISWAASHVPAILNIWYPARKAVTLSPTFSSAKRTPAAISPSRGRVAPGRSRSITTTCWRRIPRTPASATGISQVLLFTASALALAIRPSSSAISASRLRNSIPATRCTRPSRCEIPPQFQERRLCSSTRISVREAPPAPCGS
jgi:beta-glucosidase